jgi:hypothetical protein
MTQTDYGLRLKLEASSKTATILAVVTALVGLIVGLGIITSAQQGLLIATTTSGLAVASLIANAIHTGQIEPSAIQVAILTLAGQVLALLVSFLVIKETTAQHVTVIVTAVVFAAVQIAHALLSRKVA